MNKCGFDSSNATQSSTVYMYVESESSVSKPSILILKRYVAQTHIYFRSSTLSSIVPIHVRVQNDSSVLFHILKFYDAQTVIDFIYEGFYNFRHQ